MHRARAMHALARMHARAHTHSHHKFSLMNRKRP